MKRLAGNRILVTGAASGIGQATALRLLDEGASVVAADVAADGLEKTRAKAQEAGGGERLTTLEMNIAEERSVADGVRSAVGTLGGLDSVVNAAGILRAAHTEQMGLDLESDHRGQLDRYLPGGPGGAAEPVAESAQRDREFQFDVGVVRASLHGGLRGKQRRSPVLHPRAGVGVCEQGTARGVRGARKYQVRNHRCHRRIHSARRRLVACLPG